jgi:hypothetical protein
MYIWAAPGTSLGRKFKEKKEAGSTITSMCTYNVGAMTDP